MPPTLQVLLPMLAAVCTAVAVDLAVAGRGLPPGFALPWRRAMASGLLAGLLFLGTFASLAVVVPGEAIDTSGVAWWQIFTLHAMTAVTLLAWGVLAWAGFEAGGAGGEGGATAAEGSAMPPPPADDDPLPWRLEAETEAPPPTLAQRLAAEFGFRLPPAGTLAAEIGLGLGAGLLIWAAVLFVVAGIAAAAEAIGGPGTVPREPSPLVTFLAAQPFAVRLAASVSAGFCEEAFFRGFLQPRLGIAFSTLLFVLAHWSYGAPFMLVGVTLLSLSYAALARWRGNVWAAATAHATFDAVQLLVFIPLSLEQAAAAAAGG